MSRTFAVGDVVRTIQELQDKGIRYAGKVLAVDADARTLDLKDGEVRDEKTGEVVSIRTKTFPFADMELVVEVDPTSRHQKGPRQGEAI